MTTKINSKITFAGYTWEIGTRDIQELTFFLESSPQIEDLKDFIKEHYGDCKMTKLDQPTITPTAQTKYLKAPQVEWVFKPKPKPWKFPELPPLDN